MSTRTDQMAPAPVLLRDDQDGIVTLTLNRAAQYNALSADMLTSLQTELDDIAPNKALRVVVIAANGKAFCAGHDLKEMRASEDRAAHRALFEQCGRLMVSINRLPQPVIARVNGIATAAGCQLVANCDLAVAVEDARFAVSGINLGLFCSTPAVALSRNLLRKQAMQMLLTGDFISAQQAQQFGLVNEVVPAVQLESLKLRPSPRMRSGLARICFTSNYRWIWRTPIPTPAIAWRVTWIRMTRAKASMLSFKSANPNGRTNRDASCRTRSTRLILIRTRPTMHRFHR
jgi:enoyl-CoA hydratase/carnithine racemase